MALSFSQAKQIPITEYLSGIGLEPSKVRGNDYWYLSPFRDERSPSFKVNTKLNVWYECLTHMLKEDNKACVRASPRPKRLFSFFPHS